VRDDSVYLSYIRQSIELIEEYTGGRAETFSSDLRTQPFIHLF